MAYAPAPGDTTPLALTGDYAAPEGDAVALSLGIVPCYARAAGDAVPLALAGDYTPPFGDAVALALYCDGQAPGPCYLPPSGDQVQLSLAGVYLPPDGDKVGLYIVCDGITPEPPEPEYPIDLTNAPNLQRAFGLRWENPPRAQLRTALQWAEPVRVDHRIGLAWSPADPVDVSQRLAWSPAVPVDASFTASWAPGVPTDRGYTLTWGTGQGRDTGTAIAWSPGVAKDVSHDLTWAPGQFAAVLGDLAWSPPAVIDHSITLGWGPGRSLDHRVSLLWCLLNGIPYAHLPQPDPPPIIDGRPPCYIPPPGDRVRLLLRAAGYDAPPGEQVPLPITCGDTRRYRLVRTTIVQHTATLIRLPDQQPVEFLSATIESSLDNALWSFSITPQRRADHHTLMPTETGPQEFQLVLDGHTWTGLIDRANEARRGPEGGPTRFSHSGMSRTAYLSPPYAVAQAHINAVPITAQQAAAQVLNATGYNLDWRIDDWLIPAGALRYDNLTPLELIDRIAKASGAVVQSHPSDLTIIVRYEYETPPWQWDSEAPDVDIDGQSTFEMGIDWQPGALYMGVYVSGENQGVLAQVIREGSSGSPYAQMIVDPLIVDPAPARNRGTKALADSDNRRPVRLVLPVMAGPDPGIVLPGELVRVTDPIHGEYRARCDAVSVRIEPRDDAVTARQTVTLSRHLPTTLT